MRPLRYPTDSTWYADSPVGVHTLQQTVAKLCKIAGFTGHYTNHSLRATAATRLYDAGIDEQLITEKTGHRSTSVRSYKRTNEEQQQRVSKIIHGENQCDVAIKKAKTAAESDSNVCAPAGASEIEISSGSVFFKFKF